MSKLVVGEIENAAGANPYSITLGTESTTTGGVAVDFTSIPAGTTQITLMCTISSSGTSDVIFQLGDSGGFETSGYAGNVANQAATFEALSDGFDMKLSIIAARNYTFLGNLYLEDSSNNTWYCKGSCVSPGNADEHDVVLGTKSLSGALTQVRLTTSGGSDTFDAMEYNIQFQ
jgi:hypothetical protein